VGENIHKFAFLWQFTEVFSAKINPESLLDTATSNFTEGINRVVNWMVTSNYGLEC